MELKAQYLDSGDIRVIQDIEKVKELRLKLLSTEHDSVRFFENYLQETKVKAINLENPRLLAQVSYDLGLLYFNSENYIKAIPPLQSA
jgi:hypothetical protein